MWTKNDVLLPNNVHWLDSLFFNVFRFVVVVVVRIEACCSSFTHYDRCWCFFLAIWFTRNCNEWRKRRNGGKNELFLFFVSCKTFFKMKKKRSTGFVEIVNQTNFAFQLLVVTIYQFCVIPWLCICVFVLRSVVFFFFALSGRSVESKREGSRRWFERRKGRGGKKKY